jgi:tripartite-type tricarboxylate transporter receptor subunit TctC
MTADGQYGRRRETPSVVRPASSACQRRREQITAGPTIAGLLSLALIVGVASDLKADPIADFYRGKVVHMFIGYGPGGGYDLYGRLVAEFLPKHLPGNPAILPQNMPGGGSFVAARYMAEVAPKDGTALGSLAQTLALDSAVNRSNTLDAGKFHYIGRVTSNIDVGAALPSAGITSFEDVRKRRYTIGASGGGSTTVLFPAALNAYGGARFKIVRGYKGTNDILLAMERGEVDIVGAYGLPGMLVSHPGWIDKGEATILYQAALKRHRLLPNVPTLPELAVADEGRAILRAVASTAEIGRSIITTPGVPGERLQALRQAFQAMIADPEFRAACSKRGFMLDPGTGEEMDAIVRDTLGLSPSVAAKIGDMIK